MFRWDNEFLQSILKLIKKSQEKLEQNFFLTIVMEIEAGSEK